MEDPAALGKCVVRTLGRPVGCPGGDAEASGQQPAASSLEGGSHPGRCSCMRNPAPEPPNPETSVTGTHCSLMPLRGGLFVGKTPPSASHSPSPAMQPSQQRGFLVVEENLGSEKLSEFPGDTQQGQDLNSDLPDPKDQAILLPPSILWAQKTRDP